MFPSSQWEVAHLAFDATVISPVAARCDPFLKDFVEDSLVKGGFTLRGE